MIFRIIIGLMVGIVFLPGCPRILPPLTYEPGYRIRLAQILIPENRNAIKAAEMLTHYFNRERLRLWGYRSLDLYKHLREGERTKPVKFLLKARELISAGRKSYRRLKLEQAIEQLEKSVRLFKKSISVMSGIGELAVAKLWLGAALKLNGSKQANLYFRNVALVAPKIGIERFRFPPDIERIFRDEIRMVSRSPSGSLAVTSPQKAVRVYLDGRFMGVTPIILENLKVGNHFLRMTKYGYYQAGRIIMVKPREITAKVVLRKVPFFKKYNLMLQQVLRELKADGPGKAIQGFARWLDADQLIITLVSSEDKEVAVESHLFDQPTRTRRAVKKMVMRLPEMAEKVRIHLRGLLALSRAKLPRKGP